MERVNRFGIPVLSEEEMDLVSTHLDPMLRDRLEGGADFLAALWSVYAEARDFELDTRNQVPACSKGCQLCCHQTFLVTQTEFQAMIEAYDNLCNKDMYHARKNIGQMIRAWRQFVRGKSMLRPLVATSVDELKQLVIDFNRWPGIRCPFISGSDGSCLIYEARPFECRACQSSVVCTESGGHPIHSVCDFWPGSRLGDHDVEAYGEVSLHPLPYWLSCNIRF